MPSLRPLRPFFIRLYVYFGTGILETKYIYEHEKEEFIRKQFSTSDQHQFKPEKICHPKNTPEIPF
jgi:hypothetical protein